MARRKRSRGEKTDGEQTAIPFQEAPAPKAPRKELRVFPFELRAGDRWTDPEGREWQVTGRPAAYRQGQLIAVRPASTAPAAPIVVARGAGLGGWARGNVPGHRIPAARAFALVGSGSGAGLDSARDTTPRLSARLACRGR
jgi:hypothetical protein